MHIFFSIHIRTTEIVAYSEFVYLTVLCYSSQTYFPVFPILLSIHLVYAFPRCSRIYPALKFHLVMSLGTTFLGDKFCFSRKGRTGRSGWMHPNDVNSIAISGLSFRNTLVGAGWAASILLCMKAILSHSWCPFLVGKLFSQSGKVVAGREP